MDINLNDIKKHIETAKKEKGQLVEQTTGLPATGDKFLSELVNGVTRGQTNGAVAQVKAVNQATMVKDGERPNIDTGLVEQAATAPLPTPSANVNIPQPQNNYQPQNQYQKPPQYVNAAGQPMNMPPQVEAGGGDRGLYAEMERKMLEQQRIQNGGMPSPQLNEGKVVPPQQYQTQPSMLTEQITQTVTNVFNELGSNILQEAMKDTIVETYKMERVKSALEENKDVIKKIVIETIKELQNRKKAKTTSS